MIENIKSGSHATIRHFSLELPCMCFIDTVSGNLLNVLVKSIPSQMAEGDPVVLTFSGKTTFVVDCTIKNITNNMLILVADEIMAYPEERKHTRYFTSYAGLITFKKQTKFASFKDISLDGCLIVTELDLKDGYEALVSLKPDQLTTIEFKALVRRCRKINDLVFEYGLQITYISPSNSTKFASVFKELSKIEEEEISALKLLKLRGGI